MSNGKYMCIVNAISTSIWLLFHSVLFPVGVAFSALFNNENQLIRKSADLAWSQALCSIPLLGFWGTASWWSLCYKLGDFWHFACGTWTCDWLARFTVFSLWINLFSSPSHGIYVHFTTLNTLFLLMIILHLWAFPNLSDCPLMDWKYTQV